MPLGIALLFIFLHQLREPPELSKPPRLASGFWPVPDLQPLIKISDLWRYLYLFLCLVICFLIRSVAIQPLSNESLPLSRSDRFQMNCLSSIACFWLINRWFYWLMLLILFLQSFSWAVQDGIIPLNNHTSTLDPHQDRLCSLWNHLDLLDLHLFGHHLPV